MMQAGIIGLLNREPDDPTIESSRAGSATVYAEEVTYLDGDASIYTGTAAVYAEATEEVVTAARDADGNLSGIFTEQEPTREEVAVDFTADLAADPGFVTIDTADGEKLWEHLELAKNTQIERAQIDVNAFVDAIDGDDAAVWQLGEEQDTDNGYVSIDYHDAADTPSDSSTVVQFGFVYRWNSSILRGTITESGYVALYSGRYEAGTWGRWLREEVIPHAHVEGEVCARCGRATDSLHDGLCVVCRDKRDETDGGAASDA